MTTLLIIDCQKDFHPGGSLAIPSANDDAARISSLIRSRGDTIDRIVATLDSHHKLHVAHPCFWTNGTTGEHPPPFTIISARDVETGVWVPRGDVRFGPGRSPRPIFEDDGDYRDGTTTTTTTTLSGEDFDVKSHCVEYARRLESRGRFQLTIWPEHCLIGSSGHGVVDCVLDAMNEWSRTTGGIVEWVHKGENLWTEMYSALRAEVPVGGETGFNRALMESLKTDTERLLVCGQALSHCVNFTVRDIVEHWPPGETSKITILRDCASSVPGFEEAGKLFLEDMERAGVNVKTSDEI